MIELPLEQWTATQLVSSARVALRKNDFADFPNLPSVSFPLDPKVKYSAKMQTENPIAHAKFKEGLTLHQKGDLLRAEQLCKEALSAQPDHFRALNLLGEIARQLKRPECAIELIQKALRIDPNQPTSYSNLGN